MILIQLACLRVQEFRIELILMSAGSDEGHIPITIIDLKPISGLVISYMETVFVQSGRSMYYIGTVNTHSDLGQTTSFVLVDWQFSVRLLTIIPTSFKQSIMLTCTYVQSSLWISLE